jgi:hypothetical protein
MRRETIMRPENQARSVSYAGLDPVRLAAFARRYLGESAGAFQLAVSPWLGGLASAGVFRVQVRAGRASSGWSPRCR